MGESNHTKLSTTVLEMREDLAKKDECIQKLVEELERLKESIKQINSQSGS